MPFLLFANLAALTGLLLYLFWTEDFLVTSWCDLIVCFLAGRLWPTSLAWGVTFSSVSSLPGTYSEWTGSGVVGCDVSGVGVGAGTSGLTGVTGFCV